MGNKEAFEIELDLYDLAEEWVENKTESMYKCPKHKKPRFGCPGCIRQRDAGDVLLEEAKEALPDSFLAILEGE
jgi:hypothetical protein